MKVVKAGSTSLYPVPVVMVTCGVETPNIITLAWVGTLCSDPPSIGVGVRPDRFSHGLITEIGEFVVNLPHADQVGAVDYCGQVSGRTVDKWAACGLTAAPARSVSVPIIAECPVALECRVSQVVDVGVHDLFIAQVLNVQVDEEALNERGQVDFAHADLLAYAGGYYRRLGPLLGRHGDWRKGAG